MLNLRFSRMGRFLVCLLLPSLAQVQAAEPARKVHRVRVPQGGLQPQVARDDAGQVHMIYYTGDASAGDIYYVHTSDEGKTFSEPLLVNSVPGSAIAMGNIRGAHLALGKQARVHVAWMGSSKSQPKAPGDATPMLYTRLDDTGKQFEPQRNVITSHVGLDGGGSLAADPLGNVHVAWHAGDGEEEGEASRRVWVASSTDEGKTFSAERAAFGEATGACGCCGMRAFADHEGRLYMLYRSATEQVHRDMYLLTAGATDATFRGVNVSPWEIGQCVMSSASLAETPAGVLAAWETEGQVYYAKIDPATGKTGRAVAATGEPKLRKHPAVCANQQGEVLLVWTEGMGWNQGGTIAWQVYDRKGKPTKVKGRASGVPTWSLVAAFTREDGDFTVVY